MYFADYFKIEWIVNEGRSMDAVAYHPSKSVFRKNASYRNRGETHLEDSPLGRCQPDHLSQSFRTILFSSKFSFVSLVSDITSDIQPGNSISSLNDPRVHDRSERFSNI